MLKHLTYTIATTVFLFATQINAQEIQNTTENTFENFSVTHPFYHPKSGHLSLTTDLNFRRTHYKTANGFGTTVYQKQIFETIYFGLTDQLTFVGTFGNVFDRRSFWDIPTYKQDKNLDFESGFIYTLPESENRLFQASFAYGQRQSLSQFQKGEYKYITGEIKSGYHMGNVTSYFEATAELPIAQNKNAHNEPRYQLVIASNGLFFNNKVSTDVALRFNYESEYSLKRWSADTALAYLFTKDIALGIKGSYTFKATGGNNADLFDKSIGIFLKTAF